MCCCGVGVGLLGSTNPGTLSSFVCGLCLLDCCTCNPQPWSQHVLTIFRIGEVTFCEIRSWFFATNILFILTLFSSTSVFGSISILHPVSIPYLVILIISIVGYYSDSHKVQATIAIIALLNLVLGWGVQLFDPTTIPIDVGNP